jgi:hypothetical protein
MFDREEILIEYANCLENPIYCIENYFETFDKTQEGLVPFKLFPKQKEILTAYEKFNRNVVTKPRQAGISTVTQAYMSVKIGFADPKNPETILIIANKLKLAEKFLKGIKDFLVQVPRWAWGSDYYGTPEKESKDIFIRANNTMLELPNGSKVIAVATSVDALRGYTPTYLIFDEAAFIDNGAELYSAAITSLGTGGACILISTPNGQDPLYYETVQGAKNKKNNFNVIELKWYQDPRYNKGLQWKKDNEVVDEVEFTHESYDRMISEGYKPTSPWYHDMCASMNFDARKIAQELDVSFLGSGGNVVADEIIHKQEVEHVKDPMFIDKRFYEDNFGETWIWSEPIEGHRYILGADVARGNGEDYSTIVILDVNTMEQVLEYQGKVRPDKLGEIADYYGKMYNAFIVVDITGGYGFGTSNKLTDLGYPNLYYEGEHLGANIENKTPGLTINSIRTALFGHFEEMIRTDVLKIRSSRMISELRTFVYINGRPDHAKGKHDDLIVALAMCCWVLEHSWKKIEENKRKAKAIVTGWVSNTSIKTVEMSEEQKDRLKKKVGWASSGNKKKDNFNWINVNLK